MVRVISVHHFDSQLIQTCEEPLAAAVAPNQRLLVALPHHVIEVRDLSSNGQVLFTFPTVDQVNYLEHCATGNYVVTLEKKHGRAGRDTMYTRVYSNWEHCGGDQPMRARIAGRVTPSSSQTNDEALEMIELPINFPSTDIIACSQSTGNILVASHKWLCLWQLVMRTHDISRLRFLDFEQWPVTLELSFSPTKLAMVEDVVSAMDGLCLHVFRINKGFARTTDWISSAHSSPHISKPKTPKQGKPQEKKEEDVLDLDALLKELSDVSCPPKHQLLVGNSSNLPVLALLPGVSCTLGNNPARNLRLSPFKPPHSTAMGVAIKEVPANEPWAEKMTTMVESLLQLELGCAGDEDFREEFSCVALRPLYKVNREPKSPAVDSEKSCPRLRSANYGKLVGLNCLVTTQQEGYLYHFPVEDGEMMSLGRCISVYNFTSPVKFLAMEPYLLHALTVSGLETYTMRAVHALYQDNLEEACPPVDEPVCLIGLRPFIGVVSVLLSDSHMVILCSSSDSPQKFEKAVELTFYGLKLCSPPTLYTDLLAVAVSHKFTSPPTYSHLLSEAHSVLRTITHVSTNPSFVPSDIDLELYKESCALFAEFFLTCETEEEWEAGYKYCFMAGLSPTQVMDRIKKLESEAKEMDITIDTNGGLGYYLKRCLTESDEETSLPPSVLNALLDIIEGRSSDGNFMLSSLVLQSTILRQFSTERSIRIIGDHVEKATPKSGEDLVALAILHLTKDRQTEAKQCLKDISEESIQQTLLKFWSLLFDNTKQSGNFENWEWDSVTLSELAVLLMEDRPKDLAETFSALVAVDKILELQSVLQVFVTFLPSRMGSGSPSRVSQVLQVFLEGVFTQLYKENSSWKPEPETPTHEALKMLMRSYLSDLAAKVDKTWEVQPPNEDLTVFGGNRPEFLRRLPPFSKPPKDPLSPEKMSSLLKLQCLLRSGWLDESALSELIQFVSEFIPEEVGLSLLVLSQPQKAVELLLQNAPLVLPQFSKDMLTTEAEWQHLISSIQSKADEEVEAETKVYSPILEEVLDNLSRSVSCEVFCRVVPQGEEFQNYVLTSQRMAHANHIMSVIQATGQRLLATLNL